MYLQAKDIFTKYFSSKGKTQCGNYGNLLSFTHFLQNFRESNGFTKEITK